MLILERELCLSSTIYFCAKKLGKLNPAQVEERKGYRHKSWNKWEKNKKKLKPKADSLKRLLRLITLHKSGCGERGREQFPASGIKRGIITINNMATRNDNKNTVLCEKKFKV